MNLDSQWRKWIRENLEFGHSPAELVKTLKGVGMPEDVVRREISQMSQECSGVSRSPQMVCELSRQLQSARKNVPQIEVVDKIAASEFFNHYYFNGRPVVIRSFAEKWPAVKKWSFTFFRKQFGELDIPVCMGRETVKNWDEDQEQVTVDTPFASFIDQLEAHPNSNNNYLIANNRVMERPEFLPLHDDIILDKEMFEDSLKKGYSSLWVGPKGTVTSLHHDQNNIMFTQIMGKKEFLMISPMELDLLKASRNFYCEVDPLNPNLSAYPWWTDVNVERLVLEAGQALFIPIGWWHHVRSLTPSISISFLNFRALNEFGWYRPGRVNTPQFPS